MKVVVEDNIYVAKSAHEARRLDRKLRGRTGLRRGGSAKQKSIREGIMRQAICMVCRKRSDQCICAGQMTSAAQDRFFANNLER